MTWSIAFYRSALCCALLSLSAGCALHESDSSQTAEKSHAEETGEQTIKRKAPPFFIYRPGAGLTIESADGDWSVRL